MNSLRISMDADELTALLAALDSPEMETRLAALEAYQHVVDACAVEPLITLLSHWDERVRLGAVKALGHQRNVDTVPLLAAKLQDSRVSMRVAAVLALSKITSLSAIEALAAVLQDEEESVRVLGVRSLGSARNATILPVLREAMKDSSQKVRAEALFAMRYAGDEAIPVLGEALHGSDEKDRCSAAHTLAVINTTPSLHLLASAYSDAPEGLRLTVLRALHATSRQDANFASVKLLAVALHDKKHEISSTAHSCLCRLCSPEYMNVGRGLPRDILATRQLTVPEKIEILELLSRAPRLFFFSRLFDVPSVKRLCQTVLRESNEDVRSGAADVLTWLELLRHSKSK